MNTIFPQLIVFEILLLYFLFFSGTIVASFSSASSDPSAPVKNVSICNQYCPGGNQMQKWVPYPFGFSPECKIQLDCNSAGEIMIGEYVVQNVSSDNILVNFPMNCSRRIDDLQPLYGKNMGISWRNALLMQNCGVSFGGCTIPTRMLNSQLPMESCNISSENVNCYSQSSGNSTLLELSKLKETNCGVVFSSVAVDLNPVDFNTSSRSSAVSLEFATVELAWWLEECDCHGVLAKRVNFSIGNGSTGCRCQCNDGYVGDGFLTGDGCRTAFSCDPSNFASGRCGRNTKVGVLIGGIIAGAALMIIIAAIYYCIRKRSHFMKSKTSAERLFCEAAGSCNVPFYPYKEIDRATNSFSDKQRLGTGAYGTVYAGKLYNDKWVAIKKIKHHDPESIGQVLNEIKLLSSVSHPNLVRLLGCCIENGEQIIVYEFMPNGTLCEHLQRERGSGIPWTIRLTIATETAHAIAHLHSATNPPIYHRDVKSSNILLDYNFRSKVADFGLSRFGMADDSHVSTAPQGTPGYVDPQYHQNFHLSDKSDVYSFGVVLVEIITAMKVVDFSRSPHSEINLAALAVERIGKGRLDDIIDPFLEPNRDAWTLSSIHKVAELAFRCLAFHGDMRPSMTEVADELEQIRLSSWAPTDENFNTGSSVASSCASPVHAKSEKSSSGCLSSKRAGIGSRRLIVSQRTTTVDHLSTMKETKNDSPISVQEPWLSEDSSPSATTLLSKAVQ